MDVLFLSRLQFAAATMFYFPLYDNYLNHPWLFAIILITALALVGIKACMAKQAYLAAWFSSALAIVGAVFYGVIGLFPNLFPSRIDKAFSLTAHNSASSPLTLKIMLIVVIVFVPIVLAYQIWSYYLFKGKVTKEDMVY